jgi:putative Mg2+ transporter-C (MgtC) family protein
MLETLLFEAGAQLVLVAKVAMAMVLGGLVGLERDLAAKPAGLRTHMLVAGAGALLVGLGPTLFTQTVAAVGGEGLRADPYRLLEAMITGVSFLGAGTIIVHRDRHVEGLTTAASLLFSGGVGVAVALDRYLLALGVVVLALVTLRFLPKVTNRIDSKPADAGSEDRP